jgi:drug/metabolite transporter (DMT)-like permease
LPGTRRLNGVVNGYFAAAVTVLIWASYPVATRAGVTGSFAPQDLVTLRFGVGALLFLPYVMLHWRHIGRSAWLQGVPLTLFQGAGMGALAICGMQLAPANHAAALGPGVNLAWVALLGFLVFARRPSRRAVAGAVLCVIGVLLLALWTASERNAAVLAGDAMFLAASALGALYVLQVRSWGIGAIQGAAIVSLYSAVVVVPYYLWSAPGTFARVAAADLLWQVLWQGVLFGCVALIALNHAISRLGVERSSALVALVPVLTAVLALVFL